MMIKQNSCCAPKTKTSLGKVAYAASFTCMVHCILTPFIVLLAPFFGHSSSHIWIEFLLLIGSILAGTYIIYSGYCTHKKEHTLYLFAFGVLFWILNLVAEAFHIHNAEYVLLFIGSIFVLLSYRINHKYLKCCTSEDTSHS